jgi:hypothetical protein
MFREDLSRNFGFILHDVARLLRTTFDRRVRELGLTRSQWWVLNHLFRNNGVTQSELAEIFGVGVRPSAATADAMSAFMERTGRSSDDDE